MGRVDAARGGIDEGRGVVLCVAANFVGDCEQPEEPVDAAVRAPAR